MNGFNSASMWRDRRIVAQIIIIIAVCVGGWALLVEPQVSELRRMEQLIAENEQYTTPFDQRQIEQIAKDVARLRGEINAIESMSNLGRDSSRLYDQIMELARETDTRIHSVLPGRDVQRRGLITSRPVELSVEAEYDRLVEFLASLQSLPGFLRTNGVSITPAHSGDSALVSGRVHCEVFAFDTSGLLEELEGDRRAQP